MIRFLAPRLVGLCLGTILSASSASAHGGHDPRLKVWDKGDEVWVEIGLDAELLDFADTNSDGRLTLGEFKFARMMIADWIDKKLVLQTGSEDPQDAHFSDVTVVEGAYLEDDDATDHLRVLRRYRIETFDAAVRIVVHTPMTIINPVITSSNPDPARLTVCASPC